jgi:hypothetical protein
MSLQQPESDNDIQMSESNSGSSKLLKLTDTEGSGTFLVKLPQWLAESIRSSKPGTTIGLSHDIKEYLTTAPENREELRLAVKQGKARATQPSEYALTSPNAQQQLRLIESSETTSVVSKVSSTIHMIPKRDEKYTTLLKERLAQTDHTKHHRTVENEDEYATSRTAVKLFQRVESSPESIGKPKLIRELDELPQSTSRPAQAGSLDDVLMETLVNNDQGWPLQQLSKAMKDRGVTASMSQLKAKLLEICTYQRRGDDTHPKYYLKSEYK